MSELLNLHTIVSSAIGSLIAGLILLGTAPVWWKWLHLENTAELKEKLKSILFFVVLIGILILLMMLSSYFEARSIPQYYSELSNEEAKMAIAECELQSIEATSTINSRYDRNSARVRIRSTCLLSKGFEWNPPEDAE